MRRTSSSSSIGQSQRKQCRTCNNLDPRGHTSSVYPDDTNKTARASLRLMIDALSLSQTKDVTNRGCRFCNVLVQALDAFFEDAWRSSRSRLIVDLKEKSAIKVSIDNVRWKGEIIEIYAGSSKFCLFMLFMATRPKPSSASISYLAFCDKSISSRGCLKPGKLIFHSIESPMADTRNCSPHPSRFRFR